MSHRPTYIACCLAVLACAACAGTSGRAKVPTVETFKGQPEPVRQKAYEQYKLTYHPSSWVPKWTRSDGTYRIRDLDKVWESYPATNTLIARNEKRNSRIAFNIVLGGLNVGIGTASLALDSGYDTLSYLNLGLGGALLLWGIIDSIVTDNPLDTAHQHYNDSLAESLGVTTVLSP